MQKDFHFNYTFAAAVRAGIDLETAKLIAWSNQFTDECKDYKKYGIRTMVDITWKLSDCFIPEVQRSVFVPFHFQPGNNKSLKVTADSALSRELVDIAIDANDPIALGIALHGLQDTFSHSGFTGTQDNNNAKHKWDLTTMLAPRIGHAEYGHDPDIIWDGNKIDNRHNAMDAALVTFDFLLKFAGRSMDDTDGFLDSQMREFWEISNYDQRKIWLLNWANIPTVFGFKNIHAGRTESQIKQFVKAAKRQQYLVYEYMSKN